MSLGTLSTAPVVVLAGLVAVVAAGVLLLAVLRPRLALLLLVVVVVTDTSGVLGSAGPLNAYLVVLATAAAAFAVARLRGAPRVPTSPVLVLALVYLATRAISLLAAQDVPAGVVELLDEAKDLAPLLILTPLLAGTSRPVQVVAAAVAAVAVLAGLSAVQEFVLHNATDFGGFSQVPLGRDVGALTSRHSGPLSDVNFWARVLVLFFPLAVSLATVARSRGTRALCLAAAVTIAAGCYLTQSRGGALALFAAGVTWLLLSGLSTRRKVGVLALAMTLALAVPGTTSRLETLTLATQGSPSQTDVSLTDRLAVQRVSLAMFADHPVLGVGVGNFDVRAPEYRRAHAPGLSAVIAPHNLYLQMLAEGGLVGLFGWLALYGGATVLALRAWLRGRDHGRAPGGRLAAGVVAGLVGWAVASLFLHLANLRILVVVVAVGAALDLRSRHLEVVGRERSPASDAAMLGLARRRTAVRWAAGSAVLLLGVLSLALFVVRSPSTWTATVRAVVEPASPGADTAYVRDVLSRPVIMTTVAEVARSRAQSEDRANATGPRTSAPATTVTAVQRPGSAVIEISATSATRARAVSASLAARSALGRYLDSVQPLYLVGGVPGSAPVIVENSSADRARFPLACGLAAALGALGVAVVYAVRAGRAKAVPQAA